MESFIKLYPGDEDLRQEFFHHLLMKKASLSSADMSSVIFTSNHGLVLAIANNSLKSLHSLSV